MLRTAIIARPPKLKKTQRFHRLYSNSRLGNFGIVKLHEPAWSQHAMKKVRRAAGGGEVDAVNEAVKPVGPIFSQLANSRIPERVVIHLRRTSPASCREPWRTTINTFYAHQSQPQRPACSGSLLRWPGRQRQLTARGTLRARVAQCARGTGFDSTTGLPVKQCPVQAQHGRIQTACSGTSAPHSVAPLLCR